MDKPITISVKEWIIRNMSTRMQIPERTIEAVITHQFTQAHNALKLYDSFEFSGFGKFYFNRKKANKKMEKWMDTKYTYENMLLLDNLTPQKRHNIEVRIECLTSEMEILKPKLHD